MSGKILFLGDLHLGRRPITIPKDEDPARFGPEVALDRAVELARREKVVAVVFAGDVVECLEDRFEAERKLRPGIEDLLEAGIRVIAVVGNHDVFALPRLARVLPGFEILGRDGWERIDLAHAGAIVCRLHGWSFPGPHHPENPLIGLDEASLLPTVFNLGVLHCDRDASERRYAPLRSRDLEGGAAGRMDAWFLGHVHRPDHEGLTGPRPCGYLGSVVGLDPGEPGRHGPWLVELHPGRPLEPRQVALGPIRYETVDLDLEGLAADQADELADELRDRVQALEAELARRLADELGRVDACGLRLRLRGRVAAPAATREVALRLLAEGDAFQRRIGGCLFFGEKIVTALEPRIELEELARGRGPSAGLARHVLALDRGDATLDGETRARLEDLLGRSTWNDLPVLPDLPDRAFMREAALELLAAMQRQREVGT